MMVRESIAYKIAVLFYRFLKESRIYELISKLFYLSRYSIIFELVRKEAKQKYISSSLLLRAIESFYSFCITKSFNVIRKLKRFWSNSFLLSLVKSQICLFKKRAISTFIFYIFVFYVGFFIGEAIKNRLSVTKVVILFVLTIVNLGNTQQNAEKYAQNSLILNFFKEIFS